MPTCPFCRYENVAGVARCVMCYASLLETAPAQVPASLTRIGIRVPDQELVRAQTQTRRAVALGINSIALYIDNGPDPLILEVTNQAILGRHSPNSNPQPRVDLTPYGAQDRGVSRMHAIIRRTDKGLVLQDLASSNGTWLNGVKLQPYVQMPLKSGDHFQLSQIDIEIFSASESNTAN
jgi:pSer/pThr/pTyr-binding forkhead associated (FHA) protein